MPRGQQSRHVQALCSVHRRNGCYHRQVLRLVQPQRGDIWGNKRTYNGMSTLRDHHDPVDTKGKTLTGCRRLYNIGFPGKNRRVSASVRTCQCAKSRVVPDEETCRRLLCGRRTSPARCGGFRKRWDPAKTWRANLVQRQGGM